MTILEIYSQYRIPPNLQLHMFRVAATGNFILDHWRNSQTLLDRNIITQTLLLHDMGNIIKFDLIKGIHLLGEEVGRLDYWQNVQKEFKEKYGNDDHEATCKIAAELKVNDQILDTLENIGSSKLQLLVSSNNWYPKVCTYADMRVGLMGVITLNQRFDDLIERYKNSDNPWADLEKTEEKRKYALQLEKQLHEHVNFDLQNLNDQLIKNLIENLKSYSIK